MPQETGYQQQLGPARTAGLPSASPDSFGAQVGQTVSQLGATVHETKLRAYELQRQQKADSEAIDAAKRMAALRVAADKWKVDTRNNPDAPLATHAEDAAKWWETQSATLTDGITEDRVRRQVEQQLATSGAAFAGDAYEWQTVQTAGKRVTDHEATLDIAANRLLHNPEAQQEEMLAGVAAAHAMQGVPLEVRDKLEHRTAGILSAAAVSGWINKGRPQVALSMLASGKLDDVIDPERAQALRNEAEQAIRRDAQAVKAQEAADKAALRQQNSTRQAELETGAGQPSDWFNLAKQQEAAGDPDGAVRSRAEGTARMAGLQHRGEPVAQLDQRIRALDAKAASGGLTTQEASTRTGLNRERSEQAALLAKPGGALAAYARAANMVLPPLDLSNPASLRARAGLAAKAAAWAGRPAIEPIGAEDQPMFQDLMQSGTNGRLQALNAIAGFGDPRAVVGAARQIAGTGPGDGAFRVAARVLTYPAGKSLAEAIVRGEELRRKAPPWPAEVMAKAKRDFAAWYGGTFRGGQLPADFGNDTYDGAMAYMAGRSNGAAYNPTDFNHAIEAMLGKSGAGGGIYHMKLPGWGEYGAPVIAPPDMSPDQMMTRFARATALDYKHAAGGTFPVWSDGRTSLKRPEMTGMLPTLLEDGRYGFRGPNNELLHDTTGHIYAVDLHRLPGR